MRTDDNVNALERANREIRRAVFTNNEDDAAQPDSVLTWTHRLEDGVWMGLQFEHSRAYPDVSMTCVNDKWVARDTSVLAIVQALASFMGCTYHGFAQPIFCMTKGTTRVIMTPYNDETRTSATAGYIRFNVSVQGLAEDADRVLKWLDDTYVKFANDKQPSASWWYTTSRGFESRDILINKPSPVLQECYPWLPNLDKFFDDYLASSATLLFFAGPPGTGKTSLLRHYIWKHSLRVAIAYDESIFERDTAFISFMTGSDEDVLIIEDADLLLTSRDNSGNKLMSRFLNVSDGILKFPRKKIIFTTNLHDFRDIDPALTRAGRSFGFVRSRALTHEEALVASTALERPAPPGEIVLADLYNDATQYTPADHHVGFV